MTTYSVTDIDGDVLHKGRARTLKGFVERLVRDGRSLARADLRRLNLAHLDLEGADFEGAALDGADLRGTVLRKAKLRGASLRGVRAEGIQASRADFTDADMTPDPASGRASCFDGATFTYAKLDRCAMDRADFSGSHMTSSTMVGARGRRAAFSEAVMHNVDWADSDFVSCDFTAAVMRPTWKVGNAHLPDRTVGARLVGNRLQGAELGPDMQGFRRDAKVGTALRTLSWATITAGAVAAGSHLPFDVVPTSFGEGAGFIALATGAVLLKERVEDLFKDTLSGWVEGSNLAVRQGLATLTRRGAAIGSLVGAFMSSRNAASVSRCLEARGQGLFERIKAASTGGIEVVIADRRHLAEALAKITDAVADRYRGDVDTVIVRSGEPGRMFPKAVVIARDGSVEAQWVDRDGCWSSEVWKPGDHRVERNRVLGTFMRAVLLEMDLPELDLDPDTHSVRRGRDGSVVVVRRADGRLNNPYGAVIVSPDDETMTMTGPAAGPAM